MLEPDWGKALVGILMIIAYIGWIFITIGFIGWSLRQTSISSLTSVMLWGALLRLAQIG
jgi:hypothetical protein